MTEPVLSSRVALVVEQLRRRVPGGIGRVATGLIGALAALDPAAPVALVASRPPGGGHSDPLARYGFPVRTWGLPGPVLTRAWDRGMLAAKGSYDVVHGVSMAIPPATESQSPVVTIHDLAWRRFPDATTRRGRRWHEAALQRALQQASALVVPSTRIAEELAADAPSAPPMTLVTWGTDHLPPPDETGAANLLARLGVGGPFLLSASTLEPRKNLYRLGQAYAVARPRFPEPWPLVVVGPEGWGRPETPTAPDGVLFAGRVADGVLAALYRRARCFAYVPLVEGYGFPPVEALAADLPVVAGRDVPSVADPAGPGLGPPAVLVDPFSVGDIAEGLVRVATDEDLRARLSAAGRAVAGHRTWEAAARQHIELWNSLR